MNNNVIEIKSVSKAFDARRVLSEIDLCAGQGISLFVCGVNGAGKSTLLRIIAGLLQPDSGSMSICGYDLNRDPEKAKAQLGVILHGSMVYADLTVSENLSFFARLYGLGKSCARVRRLLDDVGLSSYTHDKAGVLSRGLLQRLAIARALLHKPSVLLADEPFTGLDCEASEHLADILRDFADRGGAMVMTTHDARMGLRCCDRVVILDNRRLIFDAETGSIDAEKFANDYLGYARSVK